jgi:phage shock protein PspC (stress-responsive transcriptional regulator)
MNKTVSINLGGQVFQIDELAYDRLWKYLESIKAKYANSKGGNDIISDIESRLAEMFYEFLGDKRQVITMEDVELTIGTMGHPDDFEIPLEDDDEPQTSSKKTAPNDKKQRRLFRNPDDKVIGGVASGLSEYFGIADPIWIRLVFLVTFFLGIGSSFLVYLVLMILVPKASNASEKLQMRGEPINIDNIEKTIREELSDLENRINNGRPGDKARGVLSRLVDFLATIIRLFFNILGKLVGLFFVVLAIVLIISFSLGFTIPSLFDEGIALSMLPHLFEGPASLILAVLGFGLIVFIPLLYMLYAGIAIIINKRLNLKGLSLGAIGLMLVGLVLVVFTVTNLKGHTDITRKKTETISVAAPIDGILRLKIKDDEHNQDRFRALGSWGKYLEDNDTLYVRRYNVDKDAQITLNVKRAPGSEFILEKTMIACGQNADQANYRVQNITYNVTQDSASLYFPAFYTYPVEDHIRGQEVKLDLLLPEGQSVYFSNEIRELIYDIKNVDNAYDGDMIGHTWKMMPNGLTCLDCGDKPGPAIPASPNAPSIPTSPIASTTSNTMSISSFNSIEISGAINFHLVPSSTSQVVFEDEDMMKHVTVNTSGKKLTLSQKTKFNMLGDDVTVWIYTPELEKVIVLGASDGEISGFQLKLLYIELAGSSSCDLNISTETLKMHLSGASELTATGTTKELNAEINGASTLSAFELQSNDVIVQASGASSADVFALSKLDADASGASTINYKGSPQVSSNSSGFSSINSKT